jgi:hypothetical protein
MATTLTISPTRFTASGEALDSDKRYVYKVLTAGDFLFPEGRTIDLPYEGIVYSVDTYAASTGTASTFTADFHRMRL